jgi:hypothetical protein
MKKPWSTVFVIVCLAAAAPYARSDARDKYIQYKDNKAKNMVNSVYFDCYSANPSWDGRYVRLIDAIRMTLRTMPAGKFKLVFESRGGYVYGVGTLMGNEDAGTKPVTMRAFVINRGGEVEFQRLYNDSLLESMCMSNGYIGPYSAEQLGVPAKQWKSAREVGAR